MLFKITLFVPMSKLKILIVEDESLIAEDLSDKLLHAGYDIAGCFESGEEAVKSAKENIPDLAFLDIAIAGKDDGIETARKLKALYDLPVIFLTNIYDSKTIKRAQMVKPAAYLLKPFTINQILASIHIALYNASEKKTAQLRIRRAAAEELTDLPVIKDTFFIRHKGDAFQKFKVSDILFIEAARSYCKIFLENGQPILQTTNMKHVESKFHHPHLVRISRSYIVNLEKVDSFKGKMLKIGDYEIKMGKEYEENILNRLLVIR